MGAALAQPDTEDLRHQMQLLSGFATAGAGWTILPRLTVEEELNDNEFQQQAPRRWDLITSIAPGVAVVGDLPRIQLRLNYQPTLEMHVKEGSQNVITQQLNADGLLTIIPDLFFVDVRGISGVQATQGGIGGQGGSVRRALVPSHPTSLWLPAPRDSPSRTGVSRPASASRHTCFTDLATSAPARPAFR